MSINKQQNKVICDNNTKRHDLLLFCIGGIVFVFLLVLLRCNKDNPTVSYALLILLIIEFWGFVSFLFWKFLTYMFRDLHVLISSPEKRYEKGEAKIVDLAAYNMGTMMLSLAKFIALTIFPVLIFGNKIPDKINLETVQLTGFEILVGYLLMTFFLVFGGCLIAGATANIPFDRLVNKQTPMTDGSEIISGGSGDVLRTEQRKSPSGSESVTEKPAVVHR